MNEDERPLHQYSDVVKYKLISGRPLTAEEQSLEDKVNHALQEGWEILQPASMSTKDIVQLARRATTFVSASQLAKEEVSENKPVTTPQDKIPEGLTSVIGTITAETKNASVKAVVLSASEIKTTGTGKKVQNLVIEDLSGKIALVLWNGDTGTFKENDRIEVEKGYVTTNTYQGKTEVQLGKGKFGRLAKL